MTIINHHILKYEIHDVDRIGRVPESFSYVVGHESVLCFPAKFDVVRGCREPSFFFYRKLQWRYSVRPKLSSVDGEALGRWTTKEPTVNRTVRARWDLGATTGLTASFNGLSSCDLPGDAYDLCTEDRVGNRTALKWMTARGCSRPDRVWVGLLLAVVDVVLNDFHGIK